MYDNLRAEMARKDLHQRELAESIGIAQQSLRNKLRGKCDFKLREMRGIQKNFPGCSLDYLFGEEEQHGVQIG